MTEFMSELSSLSDIRFEVNGICYVKLTDNTVAVTEKILKYSGDVIIPESVTYNDVKYSVTEIGAYAFIDCRGLKSVSIPGSVTKIGGYAFAYCDGLTSIIIPDLVTEIGVGAFYGCSGLTSIYIGANVSRFGDKLSSETFKRCELIEDISVAAVVPPLSRDGDIFDESVYKKATLRVPEAAIELYKRKKPWSKFATVKSLDNDKIHYRNKADLVLLKIFSSWWRIVDSVRRRRGRGCEGAGRSRSR